MVPSYDPVASEAHVGCPCPTSMGGSNLENPRREDAAVGPIKTR